MTDDTVQSDATTERAEHFDDAVGRVGAVVDGDAVQAGQGRVRRDDPVARRCTVTDAGRESA